MNQVGLHVVHLIPFCPAAVGIVNAATDDPALLRQRIAVMKSQVQGMQCKAGSSARPDDSLVASDTQNNRLKKMYMHFMDDSLLPENQQPLVIQVAPYATAMAARRDGAANGVPKLSHLVRHSRYSHFNLEIHHHELP